MTADDPREAIGGWVWVGIGGLASLLVPLWLLLSASLLQLDQFDAASLGVEAEAPVTADWLRAIYGAGVGLLFAIPVGLAIGTGAAVARVMMERRAQRQRDELDAATRDHAVIGSAVVTRGRQATPALRRAVVLADAPTRMLAWLVDRGLLLVALMPLILLNPAVRPALGRALGPGGSLLANGLLDVSAMLLTALLVIQVHGMLRDGQSIGKRWFAIRVVRPDGSLPGLYRVLVLRELLLACLMVVTFLLFFLVSPVLAAILALLWPVLDTLTWLGPARRALHDQWADTLVVRTSESPSSAP